MARNHNRLIPRLDLNLTTQRPKGEVLPFRVEILSDSLNQLINNAWDGLRVYELFSIQRSGDIKHYLWVKIIEGSSRVSSGYDYRRAEFDKDKYGPKCPWPDQACPFNIFDKIFFYCGDDTEEEDASWRGMVDGASFQNFLELCLKQVRIAQDGLRWSGDLVARHEIMLIEAERHQSRFLTDPPRHLSMLGEPPSVTDKHNPGFYKMLETLLAKPEIQSVAYRYGSDYRSFRMLCIEQRKRADRTGKSPGIVFPISVGNDGLPDAAPWGNDVLYFDEGLGFGDLMIDPNVRKYDTIKDLVETHHRTYGPYILTVQDNGDIEGYEKESGEGYFLYSLKKMLHPRHYQHSRFRSAWGVVLADQDSGPECSIYQHERVVVVIDSTRIQDTVLADSLNRLCHGITNVAVIDVSETSEIAGNLRHRVPLNENTEIEILGFVGRSDVLLVLGPVEESKPVVQLLDVAKAASAWLMQVSSDRSSLAEKMDCLINSDPTEFITRSLVNRNQ